MRTISFLTAVLVAATCFSQELSVKKGRFHNGEEIVRAGEFVNLMKSNTQAFELATKAKSGYDVANVLGFIGGFMVGWPLGTALGGGDPEWGLAAGGAALLGISIPVQLSAMKKLKAAASTYNASNKKVSSDNLLNIKLSPAGVGLIYSF